MTESKGWNWKTVKDEKEKIWKEPNLGCGLGRHSIKKNGFNVSCFDISQEVINRTKEWAEKRK